MENRTPFFLTNLLRRIPQKFESSEEKGWGNTTDNPGFNGWGSSPRSPSSIPITNGWADEPPDSHYNGWGSDSVSSAQPSILETTNNGWGSGSDEKCTTPEASIKGWSSVGESTTSKARYNGWLGDEPHESEPISNQSSLRKIEPWAPSLVPSAPPLPQDGYESPVYDFVDMGAVSMNENNNGDALCVVCWVARVEGACVPCGHMASCMTCLYEIQSKQGTCPICRAKIDKVMKIYAI